MDPKQGAEQIIELFEQIAQLAGAGAEALKQALGGGGGEAPPEGAPAEAPPEPPAA